MAPSILIAAGGTGGHIFPGLALGQALTGLHPDAKIAFIGTPKGLESELIPGAGYELHMIDVKPLARKIGAAPVVAAASVAKATRQARGLITERRADVVVGMGGYPTLPSVVAARWARIPSLIHESGAISGLANRIAARFTRRVALGFPEADHGWPRRSTRRVVGTPIDTTIARLDRSALQAEARAAFGLSQEAFVLLVMGGSLGALSLNRVALGLAERWKGRADVRILLKAGANHLDETQRELERIGAADTVRAVAFLDRMDLAYSVADLALCRAGAGTVAELPAAGLPSILVPYPHAPKDHQTLNARPLEKAGGAVIVADRDADPDRIGTLVETIVADDDRLRRMAEGAGKLARPDAANELAEWVVELVEQEER